MTMKRTILAGVGLFALIVLGSVLAFIVMASTTDEVSGRYLSMAVGVEDYCNANTDNIDCEAFAACYSEGLETAFPREVMTQVVEQGRAYTIPPEVDVAVAQLERNCGARVGINVVGG